MSFCRPVRVRFALGILAGILGAIGWWYQSEARLVQLVESAGGKVYRRTLPPSPIRQALARFIPGYSGQSEAVTGIRLGERTGDSALWAAGWRDSVTSIAVRKAEVTDKGLAHLRNLRHLQDLDLTTAAVTDAGLEYLAGHKRLASLILRATRVEGSGLRHLRGLPALTYLDLGSTHIGDEELQDVAAFPALEKLYLENTRVTDLGLASLHRCKSLRILSLSRGTEITQAGLERLSRELPALRIYVGYQTWAIVRSVERNNEGVEEMILQLGHEPQTFFGEGTQLFLRSPWQLDLTVRETGDRKSKAVAVPSNGLSMPVYFMNVPPVGSMVRMRARTRVDLSAPVEYRSE